MTSTFLKRTDTIDWVYFVFFSNLVVLVSLGEQQVIANLNVVRNVKIEMRKSDVKCENSKNPTNCQ